MCVCVLQCVLQSDAACVAACCSVCCSALHGSLQLGALEGHGGREREYMRVLQCVLQCFSDLSNYAICVAVC